MKKKTKNLQQLIHQISVLNVEKKTCDANNQFLLSQNGLPLIFSGPYENTNSTFPYSGNLSSADTHNEKLKPWAHVWVSHQTKARLQFIIHRIYYFTVFVYEFKLLIQIQINCANLVWIWSSFNKKSLVTYHHNHSVTVSECFSASPPEDPVYCNTVGNTVLLHQDPWIFPCCKPEIQAADRRTSDTEAIIQSWGSILMSLGQH